MEKYLGAVSALADRASRPIRYHELRAENNTMIENKRSNVIVGTKEKIPTASDRKAVGQSYSNWTLGESAFVNYVAIWQDQTAFGNTLVGKECDAGKLILSQKHCRHVRICASAKKLPAARMHHTAGQLGNGSNPRGDRTRKNSGRREPALPSQFANQSFKLRMAPAADCGDKHQDFENVCKEFERTNDKACPISSVCRRFTLFLSRMVLSA
jgi:hypothetical protein